MPSLSVRLKRLTDAIEFLRFLSDDAPLTITAEALTDKNLPPDAALTGLQQARRFIAPAQPYEVDNLSQGLYPIGEGITVNGKAGPFLGKLRLAVTGQQVSPPLFESMVALGRERTLARLDEAIALLKSG
jgi:glutamyl-tRNA synthetase